MASWFWYAVIAAVLYGAHQIFTRLAADHIGEGLGGFVVEATAALSILLYLAFLWLISRWDQKSSGEGIFYSVLTGVCVGAGTIAFFLLFKRADRFRPFRLSWLAARRSWPLPAFCFFTSPRRGSGSWALHLQSQDCFCCAGDASVMAVENERGLSL